MTIVFTASTDRHEEWSGPRRYIRVYIYETLEEMIAAATLYNSNQNFSDAVACYQGPYFREKFDEVTKTWVNLTDPHWAGLIRMYRARVETEVVVHECLHAATAIYRTDVNKNIDLGVDCSPREEHLCYIVGDLTASVATKLHELGFW